MAPARRAGGLCSMPRSRSTTASTRGGANAICRRLPGNLLVNGTKKTNNDMSSREKILSAVGANQPAPRELPLLPGDAASAPQGAVAEASQDAASPAGLASQFIAVLESIGGAAYTVSGFASIATILHEQFPGVRRVVSGCLELRSFGKAASGGEGQEAPDGSHAPDGLHAHLLVDVHASDDPHTLENVDLAILPAHFGVAENGACWITESQMLHRALPFITQHLALVIRRRDIVADMHQAYDRIAL